MGTPTIEDLNNLLLRKTQQLLNAEATIEVLERERRELAAKLQVYEKNEGDDASIPA